MKLLILGYGRHGKDTAAEYLRDRYGMRFTSSSQFAADQFIYDVLKTPLGYSSPEECYEDRHNWRVMWHQLIKAYNHKDKTRLAREIIESGQSIYVGMRDDQELAACKEACIFDLIVWVDASDRYPAESPDSCKVGPEDAHVVIDNNGPLENMYKQLDDLIELYNSKDF